MVNKTKLRKLKKLFNLSEEDIKFIEDYVKRNGDGSLIEVIGLEKFAVYNKLFRQDKMQSVPSAK